MCGLCPLLRAALTGATINGTDPFIVRDTIVQAATRVRSGGGPVLIECLVPRLWGHYNRLAVAESPSRRDLRPRRN